jgi:hypothetical protein
MIQIFKGLTQKIIRAKLTLHLYQKTNHHDTE